MRIDYRTFAFVAAAMMMMVSMLPLAEARAEAPGDPAVASSDNGKYMDKDGSPTYKIGEGGTVDWYTYSGFIRYSSECLRCHGPDGMGSSYAPALRNSMKRLSYPEFYAIVAGGKKDVSSAQELVMPANGENKNVMCFIDDIYVYLRARADDAMPRGRPDKHAPKPASFTKAEDACMG